MHYRTLTCGAQAHKDRPWRTDVTKALTIDFSHRALLARIERVLRKEHQRLRADRRGGVIRHFLIDTKKRAIIETDVDIEKLARKLNVLQPWERWEPVLWGHGASIEKPRRQKH